MQAFGRAFGLLLCVCSHFLFAISAQAQEQAQNVSLKELIDSPATYEGQTISVQGYVYPIRLKYEWCQDGEGGEHTIVPKSGTE